MDNSTTLQVCDLSVEFPFDAQYAAVVDRVDLAVPAGKTVALVGESGCGKTMLGLSIMGLVPDPGRVTRGKILLHGKSLLDAGPKEIQSIRGKKIGMIFQEPMTSLNPVFTCGYQILEVLRAHEGTPRMEGRDRVLSLLRSVGIDDATRIYEAYPHELSGGLRQRVVIAIAMACHPALIIADEPTTALDVTVQAQIMSLLREIQHKNGMSILLITHDFGVVAQMAHRVAVMYAAEIVESGSVESILEKPVHPYTQGLLRAMPSVEERKERLDVIPGVVPRASDYPPGCHFAPRCSFASDRCRQEPPIMVTAGDDHLVACWNWKEVN